MAANVEDGGRPAKLARLTQMRRGLPYMSASAMAALLQDVKGSGMPELCGRKHIKASRVEAIKDANGPFGPLIQSVEVSGKAGKPIKVDIISPIPFLAHAFGQAGSFHDFMKERLCKQPCTLDRPWHFILYADEVTPGNPLGEARRKLWVMYWSLREMGGLGLQKEACWFPLLCVKTSLVSQIDDGLSQLTASILKHTFLSSPCRADSGFFMKAPNKTPHFFAFKFAHCLQDGAAHKLMYGCKGDAGTRYCFICLNLVSERASLVQDGETMLVCQLHKTSALRMASDDDVFNTIDRLIAKKDELNAADYKLWQQACGFAYSKCGLLFDPLLRPMLKPVSSFTHDWMHCILSNGVFATTMHSWLDAVEKTMDIYTTLSNYLPKWHLPQHQACKLDLLFTEKKRKANREGCTFKSSASEALSLLPILCYFIQAVLIPASVCVKESTVTWHLLAVHTL